MRRINWPPQGPDLKRLLWEKGWLFGISAVCSVSAILSQQTYSMVPLAVLPLRIRFLNAALGYLHYIEKSFWPTKMGVFYPYINYPSLETAIAAFVILGAVTFVCIGLIRQRPYLFVGWFWFVGMLIPVIGLVQVGGQAMADRYSYLPLIGLSLAVVWGVADLVENHPRMRKGAAILAGVALLSFAIETNAQVAYWKNSQTIFEHTLAVTDRNEIMHNSLGVILYDQGKIEEARGHYEQALAINPNFAEAHNNLGLILLNQGKIDEAITHYKQALAARPDLVQAQARLGLALASLGKFDEAITHYQKAIALRPDFAEAYTNLGNSFYSQGKIEEAIAQHRKALAIRPNLAEAHYNLGGCLAEQGQMEEAKVHYQQALALNPAFASAENYLIKRTSRKK